MIQIIRLYKIQKTEMNNKADPEAWRKEYLAKQAAGVKFEYNYGTCKQPDWKVKAGLYDFRGRKEDYREVPQQKENTMTDNKTEAIPHLALRRQWLDDIEKDPKCVWRGRSKCSKEWSFFAPGVQPHWHPDNEYSPQPKTKTYYMVMVKHSGVGQVPFGIVLEKKEEIDGHLKRFHLDQVGDVVPREVEQ